MRPVSFRVVDSGYCRHVGYQAGAVGSVQTTSPGGFFAGAAFLGRGFGMYRKHPLLMMVGLVPAFIAFFGLLASIGALVYYVDNIVTWLTPYMDTWPQIVREGLRLIAMIALVMFWVIMSFLSFVTVTLIIGQPFYEAISKRVEDHLGGVPGEVNVSFWRSLPRTIAEWVRLAVRAAVVAVFLFLIQLVPIIGNGIAILLGAFFMGWVLALELTSVPFERRGLYYRDRKRALRKYRFTTLGFGAATFLCFLIPLGAVVFMPAAVAGATLLSRRILPATGA